MSEGTLRWLNKTTGYGLIRPDGRGRDLFVRSTDLVIDEAEHPLEEGAEVSYEVKQDANGMRAIAVSRRRRRYSWRDDSLKHRGEGGHMEFGRTRGIRIGVFVGTVLGGILGHVALGPGVGLYIGIVLGAVIGASLAGALVASLARRRSVRQRGLF